MTLETTFSFSDRWASGFVATVTVSSTAERTDDGWLVTFDAPFEITNIWNAEIVSREGSRYTIRNAAWNESIAAGGEVSFGFQAASTEPHEAPANLLATTEGEAPAPVPPEPPSLSVADVTVSEEGEGATAIFEIALSAASTGPVTVAFATRDGSALAGADYEAVTGTLVFAPGETVKQVAVPILDDALAEGRETFALVLSGASGGTLADSQAQGAIDSADAATPPPPSALPGISVVDVSVIEGDPVGGGGAGPAGGVLRTRGNQIVDETGAAVKLAGVNWFGMESDRFAPDGLFARNYEDMIDQMADLGFNTIRIPFSLDALRPGAMPTSIDYGLNPDLAGLDALGVLDRIVAEAGDRGLRIILDHHRPSAGAGASENGLWYDANHTEQDWIDGWTLLAQRYAGNPTVVGADLHNEPHGPATWGGGGATDWPAAAERAGDAIHAVNPDWLIFVEGVGAYEGDYYWWGGNLQGVRDRPVTLETPDKVVYSPHDYPKSVYAQPWFQDPGFPDNLDGVFRENWGYIFEDGIAPIYLGEFGSKLADPKDVAWLERITAYLGGDLDGDGTRDLAPGEEGMSWTWWSWNPNSGDTGGILQDDWTSVQSSKVAALEPILGEAPIPSDGSGGDVAGAAAVFVLMLSEASAQEVSVAYETVAGTAQAEDFVPVSGVVVFAPGETRAEVSVPIVGDLAPEGDETVTLRLGEATNGAVVDAVAVATIRNDDGSPAPDPVPDPAPQPDPAPPSSSGGGLSATLSVRDDWGAGFVADVTVANIGADAIDGWTVAFSSDIEVVNLWNAELVSREGDVVTIRSAPWNDALDPGETATFGFQAETGGGLGDFAWLL